MADPKDPRSQRALRSEEPEPEAALSARHHETKPIEEEASSIFGPVEGGRTRSSRPPPWRTATSSVAP
jgi:hypothetical protein